MCERADSSDSIDSSDCSDTKYNNVNCDSSNGIDINHWASEWLLTNPVRAVHVLGKVAEIDILYKKSISNISKYLFYFVSEITTR